MPHDMWCNILLNICAMRYGPINVNQNQTCKMKTSLLAGNRCHHHMRTIERVHKNWWKSCLLSLDCNLQIMTFKLVIRTEKHISRFNKVLDNWHTASSSRRKARHCNDVRICTIVNQICQQNIYSTYSWLGEEAKQGCFNRIKLQ
jgi:hypothetical protein